MAENARMVSDGFIVTQAQPRPTNALRRSGCSRAAIWLTVAPRECPTRVADAEPTSSNNVIKSLAAALGVNRSGLQADSPCPRTSYTTTR